MLTRLKEFFSARQGDAYLVGGYLRDSLRRPSSDRDVDIAVSGDSQPVARELARVLSGVFVPIGPAHGVARIVAPGFPNDTVEGSQGGSWTVDVRGFSDSIEEDLARRDFSVNAMALPLSDWVLPVPGERVIDPFNGRRDLAGKQIRMVGPGVFQDDPGRLLRSVRLAAGLGFRLEPETARRVLAESHLIGTVAADRVRDELLTILSMDGARGNLEVLDRLDLLCRVIPELAEAKGVDQPKEHYWDVWGHLIHTVETAERVTKGHQNSPIYTVVPWNEETQAYFSQEVADGHTRGTLLKLAALLHDIAKPQTKHRDETGRIRFPGHSEAGAAVAARRLAQLKLASRGIQTVSRMVEHHLRPSHMMQGMDQPTPRAIYRYFRDLADVAIDTLYLHMADYLGAKGPELNAGDWSERARMVAHTLRAGTEGPGAGPVPPLVNGHELMQHFNLSPGPLIGTMLDAIEEARAAGEIADRQQALALAAETVGRHIEDV